MKITLFYLPSDRFDPKIDKKFFLVNALEMKIAEHANKEY
jgi:hypothetical protein